MKIDRARARSFLDSTLAWCTLVAVSDFNLKPDVKGNPMEFNAAIARQSYCSACHEKMGALRLLVGGLSNPSKMPCYGFSIPATRCKVGSILRKVAGSTCASCYALKGRYVFPNVRDAMERRFAILESDVSSWAGNIAALIERSEKSGYFRWHDSGDIQSMAHLEAIVWVAKTLPNIRFWLPTREYGVVRTYLAEHASFPSNLSVRLSAPMVGGAAPMIEGTSISGVHAKGSKPTAEWFECGAYTRGGECGACRACWNVPAVSYPKH